MEREIFGRMKGRAGERADEEDRVARFPVRDYAQRRSFVSSLNGVLKFGHLATLLSTAVGDAHEECIPFLPPSRMD